VTWLKYVLMTSKAYTNNKLLSFIPVLFILIAASVLRLVNINKKFPFDYDQAVPANAAYDFIKLNKISLIGQELSFEGFFLGPLHNWIQFIPYKMCSLKPDCVPYFYLVISIISIFLFYLVAKSIFGKKVALIASIIVAVSSTQQTLEYIVNSNYFLFLTSIIILYALYNYFKGKETFLLIGALFAGIATVNFNPVFIFSSIAFFITALLRKNKNWYIYLLSIIVFFINYIPLLIFNIRHENILFNNLHKFINESNQVGNLVDKIYFLSTAVAFPFYSHFLFHKTHLVLIVLTLSLIVIGLLIGIKSNNAHIKKIRNNKFIYFIPIWIIVPFVGFIFYSGHIPDYYFQQTIVPITLLVALTLKNYKYIFIVVLSAILFFNILNTFNFQSSTHYQNKKAIVNYILEDTQGENFNVYFDMPPGINTGYLDLFKLFGRQPIDRSKNLYILEFVNPTEFNLFNYHETFPNKTLNVRTIGFVHIVSVK